MSIEVLLFSLLMLCSIVLIVIDHQKYENFYVTSSSTPIESTETTPSEEPQAIATNMYALVRTPIMNDITDVVHQENTEHTKEILDKIQPNLANLSNKIDLVKTAAENIKFPTEINVKEATPEQLQSMYASISPKLLGDIRKTVKNEIIAERSKPVIPNCDSDNTDSTAQGKEYSSGCNDPAYIRKDSIPCWNCAVK
jgi:hypothetical protein